MSPRLLGLTPPVDPGVQMTSYNIGGDGKLTRRVLRRRPSASWQLAMANFNNPMGLEKVGETSFRRVRQLRHRPARRPRPGHDGDIQGGALEMSNVDLAAGVHQPDPRPARLPGQLAGDHHLRPGARGPRQHQALTALAAAARTGAVGTARTSRAGAGSRRRTLRQKSPDGPLRSERVRPMEVMPGQGRPSQVVGTRMVRRDLRSRDSRVGVRLEPAT